jgi:site-specific recombinase XerD
MESNELTIIQHPGGLDQIKALVIDGLNSPHSKTAYAHAIDDFMEWYQEQGNRGLTKATVNAYKAHLQEGGGYAPSTINLRLSAIRRLAAEAADNGLIAETQGNGVAKVKGVTTGGVRTGNWLALEQARKLINAPDLTRLKGLRDRAILMVMIGSGLRRSEVANLTFKHIMQINGRWAIANLVGKRNYVRTIPIQPKIKVYIDEWAAAAGISEGFIFRPINKGDRITGEKLTSQAIQNIVKEYALKCGYTNDELAAHDLRRTFAQLSILGGASIEQIQLSLGHKSPDTTVRYLGNYQNFDRSPSDYIDLNLD